MSLFLEKLKQEKSVMRSVDIDENFYAILGELAIKYKTSINKLVVIAIEELLRTKKVAVYKRDPNIGTVSRSYRLKKNLLTGLENLKSEYGDLALYRLVNIAIRNALIEEKLLK